MANSRPFLDFLLAHRNGSTHDELSDQLQELVAAVTSEGKGGSLTLRIVVRPAGHNSGALEVSTDTKVVLPKMQPGVSIFFASPDNNLVRTDPRQHALELREISAPNVHKGIA